VKGDLVDLPAGPYKFYQCTNEGCGRSFDRREFDCCPDCYAAVPEEDRYLNRYKVSRWIAALHAGGIFPEDFHTP
jgi:hypothetical protein